MTHPFAAPPLRGDQVWTALAARFFIAVGAWSLFHSTVISLAFVSTSAAATYYVGETGSDEAEGTAKAPFRSFDRAMSALSAGDTLVVLTGHYAEQLIVNASGTASAAIRIEGDGRPIVETGDDAILITGSYIELKGFEAHASGLGSAIAIGKGNHNVRVADNVARDSGCGGIAAMQTDYLTIEDNRVFGNARRSPWQCSGISIYQAVNVDHDAGFHNIVRRNIVYDNMNFAVDNNISHSAGKTTDGNGIIFDDSRHTQGQIEQPAYDGATLVENNVVFDNGGRGIHTFNSDHVLARNNTNYHNLKDQNLAWRENQGEFTAAYANGVKYINNIAVPLERTGLGFAAASTTNCIWDFNLIEGGAVGMPFGANACWGNHNIFEREPIDFIVPSANPQLANFRL